MKNSNIILASSSPRRIEMMLNNGINPIIIPADVDETIPPNMAPEEAVMYLSLKKALYVENTLLGNVSTEGDMTKNVSTKNISTESVRTKNISTESISTGISEESADFRRDGIYIIAADTVVCKDRIIGKPADRQEAFQILSELKGSAHFVITGTTILKINTPLRHCFYDITKVYFKDYSDDELNAYVDTEEPYDKAGAYAIQGTFGKYVDHIEGSINNVIGFPWERIEKEFQQLCNLTSPNRF